MTLTHMSSSVFCRSLRSLTRDWEMCRKQFGFLCLCPMSYGSTASVWPTGHQWRGKWATKLNQMGVDVYETTCSQIHLLPQKVFIGILAITNHSALSQTKKIAFRNSWFTYRSTESSSDQRRPITMAIPLHIGSIDGTRFTVLYIFIFFILINFIF